MSFNSTVITITITIATIAIAIVAIVVAVTDGLSLPSSVRSSVGILFALNIDVDGVAYCLLGFVLVLLVLCSLVLSLQLLWFNIPSINKQQLSPTLPMTISNPSLISHHCCCTIIDNWSYYCCCCDYYHILVILMFVAIHYYSQID